MKENIKTILLVGLIVIALSVGVVWAKGTLSEESTVSTSLYGSNTRVATLSLPGMFCGGCVVSSEKTLKEIPGVFSAEVSIDSKQGKVIYNADLVSKEGLIEPSLIKAYEGSILEDELYSG